ncbi:MAG: CerR family C-terminal domain-containing protein [Rubrivivax sp.]|jgi:AcrR family transcriptional regulator|nr:CerR family C-terminal domain-containing protein [Rubrivivax sp.]
MPPRPPPAADAGRPAEDARERLLGAGLRLFAQQGYARTSTREIAETAQVNVAAISYYFGDKAGLYRAVFVEPGGPPEEAIAAYADPSLTLDQALRRFFDAFVEPLRQGDAARLCMKLHFREMLEPTGMWDDALAREIVPMHDALLGVLRRHLGLAADDDELRRLAVCIAGLGVHLHVGRDVIERLAPSLVDRPAAFDGWADRLAAFARAMVDAESRRRAATRRHR